MKSSTCPNCGAPIKVLSGVRYTQCDYCRSYLSDEHFIPESKFSKDNYEKLEELLCTDENTLNTLKEICDFVANNSQIDAMEVNKNG